MTTITPNFLSDARVQRVFDLLAPLGGGYIVGGAVRDSLLGHEPKDVDFATPAEPEAVMAALRAADLTPIPLGVEYGVVAVAMRGEVFEITTFRHDVATDGRRAVTRWGSSLEDDAVRRDLTINALYADREGKVIDVVGGLKDIVARRIRFVGDADTRIREDRLRALRMFRFWARFGDPDPRVHAEAIAAAGRFAGDMDILSRERVGFEARGLLMAKDPRAAIITMEDSGLWEDVLPGSDTAPLLAVIAEELRVGAVPDPMLRLAAAGGRDPKADLKLSKTEDVLISDIGKAALNADPAISAWSFTKDVAEAGIILRRTRGLPVFSDEAARIAHGWQAAFPMKAADLPELSGKEIGVAMKRAQAIWLEDGLRMSKDDLRERLVEEDLLPKPEDTQDFAP